MMTFHNKRSILEPLQSPLNSNPAVQTPMVEEEEAIPQSAVLETEDINKWEMETQGLLETKYHELLGEVLSPEGVWVRDLTKNRTMNELGASEFKQELSARIFINMQMSDLSEEWIRIQSARAGKIYSDKLEDNWHRWNIEPQESNLESVGQQLHDMIFICLMIAKNQGMRKHRALRGVQRMWQPQAQETM